jgi:hypothetical protein
MFILAQMLIRNPMLKFTTNAPLLQNPCVCLASTPIATAKVVIKS